MDTKGHPGIYLLAVAFAALLSACAQITASRPLQFGYATLNIRTDSDDAPAVQIIEARSADGSAEVNFPGEQPPIKHLYLRTGNYELKVDCKRNWLHPPADGTTYRLPYGLGLDDASEKITVSVHAGKEYFLDCKPGLTKSEFIFDEDVWLAVRMPYESELLGARLNRSAPFSDDVDVPPAPDPGTAPPPPLLREEWSILNYLLCSMIL